MLDEGKVCSNSIKSSNVSGSLHMPHAVTFINSSLCPHSVFTYIVRFLHEIKKNLDLLVFLTETKFFCETVSEFLCNLDEF